MPNDPDTYAEPAPIPGPGRRVAIGPHSASAGWRLPPGEEVTYVNETGRHVFTFAETAIRPDPEDLARVTAERDLLRSEADYLQRRCDDQAGELRRLERERDAAISLYHERLNANPRDCYSLDEAKHHVQFRAKLVAAGLDPAPAGDAKGDTDA